MKSIDCRINHLPRHQEDTYLNRLCKNLVLSSLKDLETGHLVVIDNGDTYEFGDPATRHLYQATIHVHHSALYKNVLLGGTIGVGESFIAKHWTTPNLVSVIRLFVANQNKLQNMETPLSKASKRASGLLHSLIPNTLTNAKRNILAHYDLSNDFFKTFLDPTMMYSSGIFTGNDQSMHDASNNKLRITCEKLGLDENDHLLEIGTGWGGLAVYAARHYGCKVTTTTISDEQYQFAKKRVSSEGLEHLITVLNKDYRQLEGTYDKLVSIEMIEAVGHRHYKQYFQTCCRLLKSQGLMLIQAITTPDQRFPKQKNEVDFIRRYIFPGGCLPSHHIILQTTSKYTDLNLIDVRDITQDYAKTLAAWRHRFFENINQVKALGFGSSFIRLWDFYLSYCEGGFSERVIGTSQLLFAKPHYRQASANAHID